MAMELHAVHFKADYQSQDAALQFRDGVVILVYLFRVRYNFYIYMWLYTRRVLKSSRVH